MCCFPKLKADLYCRMPDRLTFRFQFCSCYDMSGFLEYFILLKGSSVASHISLKWIVTVPPECFLSSPHSVRLSSIRYGGHSSSLWVPILRGGTQTNSLGGVLQRPQIFIHYDFYPHWCLQCWKPFGIFTSYLFPSISICKLCPMHLWKKSFGFSKEQYKT